MQKILLFFYNLVGIPILYLGLPVMSIFDPKIKQGLKARKSLFRRLFFDMQDFEATRPRILIHCTSVGEWEQAVPIIEGIKKLNPDLVMVVSFFSPSGYNFGKTHPDVDLKVYLPFDLAIHARKFFDTIQPKLWIISKFDIWPNHLYVSTRRNIPVVLTAATLSEDSGRDKGIVAWFNKRFYRYFHYIFPISEEDAKRFSKLYPYPERIKVTGDTRYDRVYNQSQHAKQKGVRELFKLNKDAVTFIAGSTWPSDEEHLIPALNHHLKLNQNLRVIFVPHEIEISHLQEIKRQFRQNGFSTKRYTQLSENEFVDDRIVIIDTIGILAALYIQADIAYVGGSFGPGIHNVMEPAVFGLPVLFGPKHVNSFEAMELLKIEAAFAVENQAEIENILAKFLANSELRTSVGEKGRNLILNNRGATKKIISQLTEKYDFISQHHPA